MYSCFRIVMIAKIQSRGMNLQSWRWKNGSKMRNGATTTRMKLIYWCVPSLFSITFYSVVLLFVKLMSLHLVAVGCIQLHGSVDDEMKYNDDILFSHSTISNLYKLLNEWFMYQYVIFHKGKHTQFCCLEVSCRVFLSIGRDILTCNKVRLFTKSLKNRVILVNTLKFHISHLCRKTGLLLL